MAMMVQIGARVCVRINKDDAQFYLGRVIDKKSQPVAYHVNLDTLPRNTQEPAVWVSKANIRLLQPPWHEDLEEEEEIMNINAQAQDQVRYNHGFVD